MYRCMQSMASQSRARLVSLIILALAVFTAGAATYTANNCTIAISDQIPTGQPLRALQLQLWNPSVTSQPAAGMWAQWRVENRVAFCASSLPSPVYSPGNPTATLASYRASLRVLFLACSTIATQANRPELRSIGIIFDGCSINGGVSLGYGMSSPDRTVAVIAYCGRLNDYYLFGLPLTPFAPELQVPFLQTSNGNDYPRPPFNDSLGRAVRRQARSLWSHSLHPGVGHCDALPDGGAFEMLWLTEAMSVRVPAAPVGGEWRLNPQSDSTCWLGTYQLRGICAPYSFVNPVIREASTVPRDSIRSYFWFPTRRCAEAWAQYCTSGMVTVQAPGAYRQAVAGTHRSAGALTDATAFDAQGRRVGHPRAAGSVLLVRTLPHARIAALPVPQ